jgi:hypothetical protein
MVYITSTMPPSLSLPFLVINPSRTMLLPASPSLGSSAEGVFPMAAVCEEIYFRNLSILMPYLIWVSEKLEQAVFKKLALVIQWHTVSRNFGPRELEKQT